MPETNENFKIKFRGVRGSYSTAKRNFLEFGGNTACVEVNCGKQLIILDAGGGIIDLGLDEIKKINTDKNHQTTIILSHIHQDHIQGLQFYKPLFVKGSKIKLFGPDTNGENLEDILKMILFDKVFPLGLDEIRSDFEVKNFSDSIIAISQDGNVGLYDKTKTNKFASPDDIIITSFKTNLHPKNGCLCIKIKYKSKTLVYATDIEAKFSEKDEFINFARNCDVLIHDAQYTTDDYNNLTNSKKGFGHSTFEMAIKTKKLSNAKKLFFIHYDPEYDDNKLSILEKKFSNENIHFAKENIEITL